jgi:hypothetical protein
MGRPTTKIRAEGFETPVIINAEDFDASIHTVWEDDGQEKPKAPAKPKASKPKGE